MRHYEAKERIAARPEDVFAFVDDHAQFSSHMGESSWMMAGSRMATSVDDGRGQALGSHIRMRGRVLGLPVALDEVVTVRESPVRKAWETVGDVRLLIVGSYRMNVEIEADGGQSTLRVAIDYDLPRKKAWLGKLFGRMYAKWCVNQMVGGVQHHFAHSGSI